MGNYENMRTSAVLVRYGFWFQNVQYRATATDIHNISTAQKSPIKLIVKHHTREDRLKFAVLEGEQVENLHRL